MCIRDSAIAQKIAEGSMQLLKNDDGILPLKDGQKAVSYTHLDVYKRQAEKWIASHSKKESPRMVLLIIGNALFSVCGVMTALYAKYISPQNIYFRCKYNILIK